MFRQSDIPKRLIPCTIALGAFTFTMDALPGTPQIQNIIPTTFFKTTTWAAPWLGLFGSLFILVVGLAYIESRRRAAQARKEGYGTDLRNEPEPFEAEQLPNPLDRDISAGGGRCRELRPDQVDSALLRHGARVHARRAWQAGRHPDQSAWPRSGRSKVRCCSEF